MTRNEFLTALDAIVAEKHLLKHPFYQLWSQGKLTRENLREYAISYYPHVAAFPTYVSGVHSGCEDAALRQELLENLIEEERGTENHPALWRRFAVALGADASELAAAPRTPEVADAIAEFRRDARRLGGRGLAALYAYESQIPEVSKTKREGLGAFYGIVDEDATRSSPSTRRPTCGTGRSSGRRSGASPTRRRPARRPSRRRGAAATRSTGRSTA
jgi:pyrroloquinoline-quinone synthase